MWISILQQAYTGLETGTADYIVHIKLTTEKTGVASELWAFGLYQALGNMQYRENETVISSSRWLEVPYILELPRIYLIVVLKKITVLETLQYMIQCNNPDSSSCPNLSQPKDWGAQKPNSEHLPQAGKFWL